MRKMKNSGIEWIGNIPSCWNVVKFKSICTPKSILNSGNRELLSVYLDRGVIRYSDSTNMQVHKPSESLDKYQNVDVGDLVMNNQQAWRGSVGVSKYKGIISPAYLIYQLSDACYPDYLNYVFRDCTMVQQYEYCSRGVGSIQRNVSPQWLKQALVLLPPLDEQKKIAEFLDKKCYEIDALIADIQTQIETLEQYKRSTIIETVLKGLNPVLPIKDSSIDWIGEIPSHWNTHPLYYYFTERKNANALGQENNLLSLSYGRIIRKDINTNGGLLPNNFNTYNIIEKDDIVLRLTDLQNDKRSLRTGIARERGIITSAYVTLCAIKPLNAQYFYYLLYAYDLMKVLYNMGAGVRQGLNYEELSKMMLIEPSLDEQNEIVEYLDKKCSEVDACISDKKEQIVTLEAYKKSIIFEYVTGKKEVE